MTAYCTMNKRIITILLMGLLIGLSSCAYYNTFYNAKKFYRQASKEREKRLRSQTRRSEEKTRGKSRSVAAAEQYDMNRPSTQEMQNYAKAIEKASAVLRFYPNSKYVDDALILLGKCFFYRREYPKAKRKFEELIGLYPNSEFILEAKLLLAKTHLELKEYTEAEEILTLLILDDRTKRAIVEEAQQALGDLYYRQLRYDAAAEAYRKAAKEARNKQNRALALYRLGDCLLEMKQYEEVPEILRKAVKESPDNEFKSQAVYRLGEAQRLVHDYQASIKTFTKLMAEEMDIKRLPMVKYQLAESIRLSGDIKEAIKWYEVIIEDHKRTDAAARSYFALGGIQEKLFSDFKTAKESYDKVRGEFANSEVVPESRERSEDIGSLLELRKTIARLEGRAVDVDSTGAPLSEDQLASAGLDKDDSRIDIGSDGMWLYYIGRLRPPPKSLSDLSEADRERSAIEEQMVYKSVGDDSTKTALSNDTIADSTAMKLAEEKREQEKKLEISKTKLQLAELLLLRFDMVDSALALYIDILEQEADTILTAKALYSSAYIFDEIKHDSLRADSLYRNLLNSYSETDQANGARRALDLPIEEKIDEADIAFKEAEQMLWQEGQYDSAMAILNEIVDTYPQSELSSKATYTQGWILEHRLANPDSAFALYSRVVDQYPSSEYAKAVKSKIAAVENVRKEQEAKQKAIADSIAAVQKAIADSIAATQKAAADSLLAASGDSLATSSNLDSTKAATKDTINVVSTTPDSSSQIAKTALKKNEADSSLDEIDAIGEVSSNNSTQNNKTPVLQKDEKSETSASEIDSSNSSMQTESKKSEPSELAGDKDKPKIGEDKKTVTPSPKVQDPPQQQEETKTNKTPANSTEKSPPRDP